MEFNKKIVVMFLLIIVGVFSFGNLSAMNIKYFYSDTCPHCQKTAPFIQAMNEKYSCVDWDLKNVALEKNSLELKEYGKGVPTIVINDEIILSGSKDIPERLECEINEMSTEDCLTYSADNSIKGSWFKW